MITQLNLYIGCLLLLKYVSVRTYSFLGHPSQFREGSVRLFGSRYSSEGRVEIYHDGKWGTVCDDEWDMTDANVVCRQLNFPGATSVVSGTTYGEATGPIWLDDVGCEGTETQLVSCKLRGWGEHNCNHNEDVGVICETGSILKSNNMNTSDAPHFLDHSASLSDVFGNVFDSGAGCDFLITFQSPNGNIQMDRPPETVETTICAHKLILMQCPFFQHSVETNNITINVSKPCQPHFTSFIRYLYTHQINVTISSAMCIHQLASDFGLKQLMEDAGRLLSQILPDDASFNTQVSLCQHAVQTKDKVLEENCVQYLAWNFQNLTTSPSWADLPVKLLRALLTRSDLVVPDEFFLHQSLESWITNQTSSISLETQIDLLHLIRFPLIPADKLQDLKSNSLLYQTHKIMYLESVLKAYEFNVLLFNSHYMDSNFSKESDDYKPRIYTTETWSTVVNPSDKSASYQNRYDYNPYNQQYNMNYYRTSAPYTSRTFRTPINSSLFFKDKMINWDVNFLKTQGDCSRYGERCESVPAARLAQQSSMSKSNILFRNRLLLMCKNKYICQVQGFNGTLAYVSTQALAYPCPDEQYTYIFVVRPDYV